MRYGRELLKGSTDALLLSLINRQQMYGYQIIKELEERSKGGFGAAAHLPNMRIESKNQGLIPYEQSGRCYRYHCLPP